MPQRLASNLPSDLFTCAQTRALDAYAIEALNIPGIVLMKRAARAVFAEVIACATRSITVLCGRGNNAGDGYIVAGFAKENGFAVQLLQLGDPAALQGDAATARDWAIGRGVSVEAYDAQSTFRGTLLVDALLGTGISGAVRAPFSHAIESINAWRAATGGVVLAVDVPSGICADSGAVLGCAVQATRTVTFIVVKRGLLTGAAPAHVGALKFDDLGLTAALAGREVPVARRVHWGAADARPLPARTADAHKGQSGHVLIVGGGDGMGGAAMLAAEAALRSGAGLVSVACAVQNVVAVLARCPAVMCKGVAGPEDLHQLIARASVLVVGPGLGQSEWARGLLDHVLQSDLPLVLDADALNLVAELDGKARQVIADRAVLTPHPGEAARLLATTTQQIQADRFAAARRLSNEFNCPVVLKGAGSLIDDGQRCYVCGDGNPGMAVAGMGDVLSGVVGALMAQGVTGAQAAVQGVCLHAAAGDAAARAGQRGLVATDLMPELRRLANGL